MAMTLNVTAGISVPAINLARESSSLEVEATGDHWDYRKLTIGTTEETVVISPDITDGNDPGYAFFYNADATNYVRIGFATTAYFMRLGPGQSAILPLDAAITQLFMIANAAACKVEFFILER